jgi:hypothetical protein
MEEAEIIGARRKGGKESKKETRTGGSERKGEEKPFMRTCTALAREGDST